MKIAMVSEHASPLAALGGIDAGGQNVHVAELSCALGARGHDVVVYTRRDARSLPTRVRIAPNVVVEHVGAGPPVVLPKDELFAHMDAFGAALLRAWATAPPDVAHSHFWMSGLATAIATRPLGIPWVHTYHALGAEKARIQGAADTSPSDRIAHESRILRDADCIVATATAEIREHRRQIDVAGKCTLVPCGVDLAQFTACAPFGRLRMRRHRIATLSRLVARKGVDVVIRALAEIPETELLVAGGGESRGAAPDPERRRLETIARACGVDDRVFFIGRVSRAQVGAYLSSADVVLCTPQYEPFGIVPLEAMACGRPVVASRVGGLTDTVVDGETGTIVTDTRPATIAAAVRRLLDAPALRARLGGSGRARVERRYTWTTVAEATEGVYRRMLAAAPAAESSA